MSEGDSVKSYFALQARNAFQKSPISERTWQFNSSKEVKKKM